jgi:hypothetical protein
MKRCPVTIDPCTVNKETRELVIDRGFLKNIPTAGSTT